MQRKVPGTGAQVHREGGIKAAAQGSGLEKNQICGWCHWYRLERLITWEQKIRHAELANLPAITETWKRGYNEEQPKKVLAGLATVGSVKNFAGKLAMALIGLQI